MGSQGLFGLGVKGWFGSISARVAWGLGFGFSDPGFRWRGVLGFGVPGFRSTVGFRFRVWRV